MLPIDIQVIVNNGSASWGLDPKLIEAVIQQESGGNMFAWNPEPKYRYLWNVRTNTPFRSVLATELLSRTPPLDFPTPAGDRDQEWLGQAASWGLMQLMGAVAREQGFKGPYLTQLITPAINIAHGCRKLASDLKWAQNDVAKALCAYNGGRGTAAKKPRPNQRYADDVLERYAKLQS